MPVPLGQFRPARLEVWNGHGGEAGYPAPTAQIPACAANAPGFSLEFWRQSGDRTIGRGHIDSFGAMKNGFRPESLSDHGEANDPVCVVDIALALPNPGRNPPRHENRIALDIGREIKELLRRIRECTTAPTGRHKPCESLDYRPVW